MFGSLPVLMGSMLMAAAAAVGFTGPRPDARAPMAVCELADGSARAARSVEGVPQTAAVEPDIAARPGTAAGALVRAAAVLRPATEAEAEPYLQAARTSPHLCAARARLAPRTIDEAAPRFVGTTIGQIGLYFPVRGPADGSDGQYTIWFDTATEEVVAEAEFVRDAGVLHLRLVVDGDLLHDGPVADGDFGDGDFWECLRMCLGEVLNHDLYILVRSACQYACKSTVPLICQGCLVLAGALEAGMVSGCTYTCWR